MTDRKDGPGQKSGPPKPGDRPAGEAGAPKRPYATIDLKAVEVAGEADKPAVGAARPAEASQQPKAPAAAKPPTQAEAARRVAAAAAALRGSASTGQTGATAGATGSVPASGAKTQAKAAESAAPTLARETAKPAGAQTTTGNDSPTAAAPRQRSGFGSHVAAAVGGAALALLLGPHLMPRITTLMDDMGLAPPPAHVSAEIAQRLATVERTLKAPPPAPDPARDPARAIAETEAAKRRIDELQRNLAQLTEQHARTMRVAAETDARLAKEPPIADVGNRLVQMEQLLSGLAAAAQAEPDRAGRIPQLASIAARISDLETQLASRIAEARKETQRDLEQRLQPTTEASEAARTTAQRLDREVTGLKTETNRIATGLDQVRTNGERLQLALKAAQDETAQLASALDAARRDLDARVKAAAKPSDVTAAVAPLASQLSALEQNLTTVVRSETERNATAERIVLSLELANLKRAMERGAPYAGELAEVRRIAGTRLDLAPLDRYRNEGVPTLGELGRNFRGVANAILDADAEKGDGTVVDRLLSGAKTLVRVRRTTPASGDTSPEAVVARMEEALKAGRLGDVIKEAKALERMPDAAKAWLSKVEARQTVDGALKAIDDSLKAALGAGAAPAAQPAAQRKAQ